MIQFKFVSPASALTRLLLLAIVLSLATVSNAQLPIGNWPTHHGNALQSNQGLGGNILSAPGIGINTGVTPYSYLTGTIIGQNGFAYVVSQTQMSASSLTTGQLIWSFPFGSYLPAGDPVVDKNGTVYVALSYNGSNSSLANTGILYALKGTTGAEIWEYHDNAFKDSPFMGPDGTIYVGIGGSKGTGLCAVDSSTGQAIWEQVDSTYSYPFTSGVFGQDGIIYAIGDYNVNYQSGTSLYAIQPADGSVLWKVQVGPELYFPCMGPNGWIYFIQFGGTGSLTTTVYAVNPATQEIAWESVPTPSNAAPLAIAPNGDVVLLEYGTLELYDYDGNTGNLRWSTPLPSDYDGLTGPIIGQNGEIYVSANSAHPYLGNSYYYLGQFVAVNEATGNIDWTWTDENPYVEGDMAMDAYGNVYVPEAGSLLGFPADQTTSLSINPASVLGGTSVQALVTLTAAAPPGGAVVSISGSPSGIPPQTVTITAGEKTASFTLNTTPVTATTIVTVSATPGPATATLTINPPALVSCTVKPTSVIGGIASTGTVTIGSAAPPGGLAIALQSSNSAASVPATVTVLAGKTSATFTITTAGVPTQTTSTITASFNGQTSSAQLVVNPAALTSLTISPSSVLGSNQSTGTVTLSGVAPPGGLAVTLASNNSAATVPASVTISAQSTTATFTISTVEVTSNQKAIVTATLGSTSQQSTLSITALTIQSLTLNPTSVLGGSPSTATLTLSGPGASGGTVISLSSGNSAATVPGSVTVAPGQTTATFSITTVGVNSQAAAIVTAKLNASSQSATLTITPTVLLSIKLNPATVQGGSPSSGTLTLSGPAGASGTTVSLSSGNSSASVPGSVTVAAGMTTGTFAVTTIGVNTQTTASIAAKLNASSLSAALTITPASLLSIQLNPTSVQGGNSSTGTVTLNGPAGSGGTNISLSSNAGATVPATVMVAAGSTSATFTVKTQPVNTSTTATLTATLNSQSKSATLSISASALQSLSLNPTTVLGGNPSTGTVTIGGPAGTGGQTVALTSGSQAATVPASVTIPAGQSSATFTVSTVGVSATTTATITATLGGVNKQTSLTITPTSLQSLSLTPSTVAGVTPSTGTVTLAGQAPPGGLSVTLASNTISAAVPGSVSISGGQSSATFTVACTPVTTQTTAKITASLSGTSKSANLILMPVVIASISVSPSSVYGGISSNGTVTLNGLAPVGGITLKLSSSTLSASAPASITVPAGSMSATFLVKTTPVATQVNATITAKLGSAATSASLTIEPPALSSVTLSPTMLTGGTSATGTVSLTALAPSAGLVVKLASNQSSAIVPSSVKVPAGKAGVTFAVKTTPVSAQVQATVTGVSNGVTETAELTIKPPALVSLKLSPTTVIGGKSSIGTVTVSGPAPTGGLVIALSSSTSAASVAATVKIAAGKSSATFSVKTVKVKTTTPTTVSATLSGSSVTAVLTVN